MGRHGFTTPLSGASGRAMPVSGQAGAVTGAGGSAGRGWRQESPARQNGDVRPQLSSRGSELSPGGERCGDQSLDGVRERVGPIPGGQRLRVQRYDGLDADGPQLVRGPAGAAQPRADGVLGYGESGGDRPVAPAACRAKKRLPDDAGGVRAARQQSGIEDHVRGLAAGAPRPVRTDHELAAIGVTDRPGSGSAPRTQDPAAPRTGHRAPGQRLAGRHHVERAGAFIARE